MQEARPGDLPHNGSGIEEEIRRGEAGAEEDAQAKEEQDGDLDPEGVKLTEDMARKILSGEGLKHKRRLHKRLHGFIDALTGIGTKETLSAAKLSLTVRLTRTDEDITVCEKVMLAEQVKLGRISEEDVIKFHEKADRSPKTVEQICKSCIPCARTKPSRRLRQGLLKPLPVPHAPWRDISIDYVTPLPKCLHLGQEFKHVAVVVDRLTKMRHFIPTVTMEPEELADRFIERVFSLHGLPDTVLSDCGSQFISRLWSTLCQRLGIVRRLTSAFHPQSNAQTERINVGMEKFLRLFINWTQTDWARWLPIAEFAGNNMKSETTGQTPFFANYAFHPRMGIEPATPCQPNLSPQQQQEYFKGTELATGFNAVWDSVVMMSRQTQDRYKNNANMKRQDAPRYKVGYRVMLDTTNLVDGRPHKKYSAGSEGPFDMLWADTHNVKLKLRTPVRLLIKVPRGLPCTSPELYILRCAPRLFGTTARMNSTIAEANRAHLSYILQQPLISHHCHAQRARYDLYDP